VIFDRAAEQLWKAELLGLQERAIKLRGIGEMREKTCFSLEGKTRLEAALWGLDRLSRNWVTPKLSVGPAARVTLNAAIVAEARKKIAELKPLPHDWKPQNQQQETLLNRD
jgi:hypothetical protein